MCLGGMRSTWHIACTAWYTTELVAPGSKAFNTVDPHWTSQGGPGKKATNFWRVSTSTVLTVCRQDPKQLDTPKDCREVPTVVSFRIKLATLWKKLCRQDSGFTTVLRGLLEVT